MNPWSHELDVAIQASKKSVERAFALQPGIQADEKADKSPVTQADRECEKLIARLLLEAFPRDGVLAEEGTHAESSSGRRWIIDPIDGTRDYLRGNPLWANLIALEDGGEIVAGVVNLAGLGQLYAATRGGGAYMNCSPIRASSKVSVDESVLCFNAFSRLGAARFKDRWLEWMTRFWAVRGLGGAPDAMLVASGKADIWIEPSASPWDFAPIKVIAEEAGARFFNFDGGSSIYAGNCVVCAPALELEARQLLGL